MQFFQFHGKSSWSFLFGHGGLFEDTTEICKGLNTVELAGFDGDATFRRHLHLGFAEPGAEGLQQGARCWRASAF